jgi:hypothetical protein
MADRRQRKSSGPAAQPVNWWRGKRVVVVLGANIRRSAEARSGGDMYVFDSPQSPRVTGEHFEEL